MPFDYDRVLDEIRAKQAAGN